MAAKKTLEYMLVNRKSKKALQATGLDNGQVVEQSALTGSDVQLWSVVESGESVKLVNKASGKVLDVMAEGTSDGTWAQIWEDVDGGSQQWKLVKLTATYSKIVNVRSGKVLDIVDMSEEDGAPAQIWEDVNGVGQQWKLVPAEKPAAKRTAKKPAAKKAAVKKAPAAKAEKPVKAAAKKAEPAVKPQEKPQPAPVKAEPKAAPKKPGPKAKK